MTCCSVIELLLPGLALRKMPRMLLGWELAQPLLGLFVMETKPESLGSEILELLAASAESESAFSLAGITGLTPSRDLRTVEDCSVSASLVKFSSLIFLGVDVVLFCWEDSDISIFLSETRV